MRLRLKRFYKAVTVEEEAGGFRVLLDGRPVKTPAQTPLTLPTLALAQGVADEWAAQEGEIAPLRMPLTRLAATILDRAAAQRQAYIDEIAAYAGNDLVCYRAADPAELVTRQQAAWDPWLAWIQETHGVALTVTAGLIHVPQPTEAVAACRAVLEGLAPDALTVAHVLTGALGSAVLALAVVAGALDAEAAALAAQVDELYQAEKWGEDREALVRRRELRADIVSAARYLALARPA